MKDVTYISIPCEYDNKVLVVKALGLTAKGDSPDQALLESIKSTPLYMPLMLAKFKSWVDFRGRSFMHLEVPFDAIILKKINDVEPYPAEKKPKSKSLIAELSPEEFLRHAYPDLIK